MKIPEKCEMCKELVKSRSQIVNGYGNENAKIMFIGICPGNHLMQGGADRSGIPFMGDKSGELFEKMLDSNGLTRTDVYATNIVKCRPASKDRMYNRLPTTEEIYNCKKYLVQEINVVKPKVIICLGKLVYNTIEPDEEIKSVKLYHWHPGFVARSPEFFDIWIYNIKHDIKKWTKKMFPQSDLTSFNDKK
jgi:uracil-DNA glycosylase family 4